MCVVCLVCVWVVWVVVYVFVCVMFVCVGGERELVVIYTPLRVLGIVVVCGMEGWG